MKIISKICYACACKREHAIIKLLYLYNDLFEIDSKCDVCGTEYHYFITHEKLLLLERIEWS